MDKVLTLLGFAAKAGKLAYGMNAVVAAVSAGRAKLVLVSDEISAKSRKEVLFYSGRKEIPVILLSGYDIKTVSDAVGRKCGIVSVGDSSFADALRKALESGGNANDK